MKKSLSQRVLNEMTSHLRTKLVMLLLAALCWLLVRSSQEVEVEFDLPLWVDLSQVPGQILVNTPPREVHVRLRGKGSDLLGFALFREGVYHLRPDVGSGTYAVSAKHLDLEGAENLSVQSIFPAVLQLRLDEMATRRLPVRFRGEIEAADGFKLTSSPVLEPAEMVVMGPRSVLDTLSAISTDWTELVNRKREVDVELQLRRPWPTVEIAGGKTRIKARIEKLEERRFDDLPLEWPAAGDTLLLDPDTYSLTLIGGPSELDQMDPDSLRAQLAPRTVHPDSGWLDVLVHVPAGLAWKDLRPGRVELRPRILLPDSLLLDSLKEGEESSWRLFP
jgi:hypothetical protein